MSHLTGKHFKKVQNVLPTRLTSVFPPRPNVVFWPQKPEVFCARQSPLGSSQPVGMWLAACWRGELGPRELRSVGSTWERQSFPVALSRSSSSRGGSLPDAANFVGWTVCAAESRAGYDDEMMSAGMTATSARMFSQGNDLGSRTVPESGLDRRSIWPPLSLVSELCLSVGGRRLAISRSSASCQAGTQPLLMPNQMSRSNPRRILVCTYPAHSNSRSLCSEMMYGCFPPRSQTYPLTRKIALESSISA